MRSRIAKITAVATGIVLGTALTVSALMLAASVIGPSGASAATAHHKPRTCATFFIQTPDVNPPPGHFIPATPELLYFTFCGSGIKPGKWFCPVKPGAPIADRPLACKR